MGAQVGVSHVAFGLGIKGFGLRGGSLRRQKQMGSGGGYFWKMVHHVQRHEGLKHVLWSGNREKVFVLGRKVCARVEEGKARKEVRETT